MFELQIDELSKKIIGYHAVTGNSNNGYVVDDDINKYLVEQKNGLRMLADNLYFIDGRIEQLDNQPISIMDQIRAKQVELSGIRNELSNVGDLFAQKLVDGMTFEEAADYIKERKQLEISLKTQIDELDTQYATELEALYKQRDADVLATLTPKYYSSVCLLIKDENEYLSEWIEYYINLGVDHIYIYDNGNVENVSTVIEVMPANIQSRITVIEYKDYETDTLQQDVYTHFLNHYGCDTRWVGFLDSDEFVVPKDGSECVNELLNKYEDYGALYMSWIVYNANGQEFKTSKPVRERFTSEVPEPENHIFNKSGKTFIQPYKVDKLYRYHPVFKFHNKEFLNENSNKDIAVVNHYYTKSLEEWQNKIERGSCDSVYRRTYNEFFKLNPDMAHLNDGKTIIQDYNTSE